MLRITFWFFVLSILLSGSCTPHRKMVYFQDKQMIGDTVPYDTAEYNIKPGDILHVHISTMEEESYYIFNNEGFSHSSSQNSYRNEISIYVEGYTVSKYGYITMPVLGDVYVEGYTIEDATKIIQDKIDRYLKDATVIVKIVNFNITVVGEVRRPGNYYVYNNQLTVIDALGLAGDMTTFGKREINIIRHTPEGAKFATIDLTDRQAFSSEFFYLHSNDIVYVEPTFAKRLGFAEFPFSVLFSAISTTILLISFID